MNNWRKIDLKISEKLLLQKSNVSKGGEEVRKKIDFKWNIREFRHKIGLALNGPIFRSKASED